MSSGSSGKHAPTDHDHHATLESSLLRLEEYVRVRDYQGTDPYDALNSPAIRSLPGKMPKVAMTQLFVYSPIDMRRAFGVREGRNPKAVALFLSAYCDLRRGGMIDERSFTAVADRLVRYLLDARSPGYHGNCWGFNFDWQDITRFSRAGLPTVVISSYVGNALLDLYDLNGRREMLDEAMGISDFILQDLNVREEDGGVCFSYTPIDHHVVHNANMLAASLLSRLYHHTGREDLLDRAIGAVDFTVQRQEPDGSWAYSIDPRTGDKRRQLDFHQGFVLDALSDFMRYSGRKDPRYVDALLAGARFYREEQFEPDGRSLWRLPRRWPVDIHHQAQGVVTFSKLARFDPQLLEFASRIALWTVENMQDPRGYFHHQIHERFENRIAYMRWGQAWMMYALGKLLAARGATAGDVPCGKAYISIT
ncbi:MAG: hypothetical protein ISF22_04265 [Methanomassiliicoccus sp.]|nr:hypothetical protein [Methanomassiliicoccus sp.]